MVAQPGQVIAFCIDGFFFHAVHIHYGFWWLCDFVTDAPTSSPDMFRAGPYRMLLEIIGATSKDETLLVPEGTCSETIVQLDPEYDSIPLRFYRYIPGLRHLRVGGDVAIWLPGILGDGRERTSTLEDALAQGAVEAFVARMEDIVELLRERRYPATFAVRTVSPEHRIPFEPVKRLRKRSGQNYEFWFPVPEHLDPFDMRDMIEDAVDDAEVGEVLGWGSVVNGSETNVAVRLKDKRGVDTVMGIIEQLGVNRAQVSVSKQS